MRKSLEGPGSVPVRNSSATRQVASKVQLPILTILNWKGCHAGFARARRYEQKDFDVRGDPGAGCWVRMWE
jgi:hypothetical protein